MNQTNIWIKVGVFALACGLCAGQVYAKSGSRYQEVDLKENGTIIGVVSFDGEVPKPKKITVVGDEDACHKDTIYSEALVVSADKKIKWAVASLKKIKQGKPFPKAPSKDEKAAKGADKMATGIPAVPQVNQLGCRFIPHVALVGQGRPLKILNSDNILHNVHAFAKFNRPVNKAMPKTKKEMEVTFKRRERIKLRCDIHKWMGGWVIVAEHPYYAVTGDDGKFQLVNVPVGTHKLEVWHETLGKQVKEVTVKNGEETRVEFVFKKK